jgi:hypothetical protein
MESKRLFWVLSTFLMICTVADCQTETSDIMDHISADLEHGAFSETGNTWAEMRSPLRIIRTNITCGRYRLSRRKQIIEEHFDSVSGEEDWTPRYNVAPTQSVPVIRQNPKEPIRQLSLMRWGLIPSWSKDSYAAASMINARSETASTKPSFRDALKSRRCLIPADGFYEWMRTGKTKQPYCFEINDGELFAFAGIWERWKDPSGRGRFGRVCIQVGRH